MSDQEVAFQPGDIVACFGTDVGSRAISIATASLRGPSGLFWGPSHAAILCPHAGELLWVESTTFCRRPCRVQGRVTSGVQAHAPRWRIADYLEAGGRVDLYRLAGIESLSLAEADLLSRILIRHFVARGIDYDLAGALLSGTRVLSWTHLFPGADLNHLFCSELIAAVLMRLGRMARDNPSRFHPARLLRQLVRCGTYRRAASWRGSAT